MLNNKTLETNLGKLGTLQLRQLNQILNGQNNIFLIVENGPDTVQYTVGKEGSRK